MFKCLGPDGKESFTIKKLTSKYVTSFQINRRLKSFVVLTALLSCFSEFWESRDLPLRGPGSSDFFAYMLGSKSADLFLIYDQWSAKGPAFERATTERELTH